MAVRVKSRETGRIYYIRDEIVKHVYPWSRIRTPGYESENEADHNQGAVVLFKGGDLEIVSERHE